MDLPVQYVENMRGLLGEDELAQYLQSFSKERYSGLRFNLLKCNPDTIKMPFPLTPVPWCKEGRYFLETKRPAKHPYYYAGLYYLQEPSAMSPGGTLPVSEHDRVLDLCAAPGGKATQLASRLQGTGLLFANDISAGRTKALLKNLEMFGVRNAIVLSEKPENLAKRLPGFFDKIIIDAPCSGEGMFRREPDMIKSWNGELIEHCKRQQKILLEQAAILLRPGGMILYSTCTFSTYENEQSILEFLNNHSAFSLCPIEKKWGFQKGVEMGEGKHPLEYCARLYPHRVEGEGHFMALLHKEQRDNHTSDFVPESGDIDSRMEHYHSFSQQVLKAPLKGVFKVYGDTLCLLPENTPLLKGLRVLRSGWQLGSFKKNRFEPSHALAMGLTRPEVENAIDFTLADDRVIRYLKGETVDVAANAQGWHVVFVDGYPLGFGKVQNGRLKNKYPASWKWE